jgi:DNA-binding response OmpR family regulator
MSGPNAPAGPVHPRVILVEDDWALSEALAEFLVVAGFTVVAEATAVGFYDRVVRERFDVAVVDLGLPDLDGCRLVDYLHSRESTPVVVITADTTRGAERRCLDAGADLCLLKPFEPDDLLIALRRLVDRSRASDPGTPTWQLDSRVRRLISPDGSTVALTAAECLLLERFAAAAGGTIPRHALIETLYDHGDATSHNALEAHIRRLRRKLGALTGGRDLILTSYGAGYSFAASLVRH